MRASILALFALVAVVVAAPADIKAASAEVNFDSQLLRYLHPRLQGTRCPRLPCRVRHLLLQLRSDVNDRFT
ncbi:hypothetical protein BC828DRAFT_189603 [Blastocladiella britannica]|nr:hypothetical protein BC828DRAFT_189603 [Blastocladiella britannica]